MVEVRQCNVEQIFLRRVLGLPAFIRSSGQPHEDLLSWFANMSGFLPPSYIVGAHTVVRPRAQKVEFP